MIVTMKTRIFLLSLGYVIIIIMLYRSQCTQKVSIQRFCNVKILPFFYNNSYNEIFTQSLYSWTKHRFIRIQSLIHSDGVWASSKLRLISEHICKSSGLTVLVIWAKNKINASTEWNAFKINCMAVSLWEHISDNRTFSHSAWEFQWWQNGFELCFIILLFPYIRSDFFCFIFCMSKSKIFSVLMPML